MKKFFCVSAAFVLSLVLLSGCSATQKQNDTLMQVSTIQALTAGDYYGSVTVSELLQNGSIGLGTFEGVNGEMIVLDGKCYQALGDGTVVEADKDEKIPFANITPFDEDSKITLNDIDSIDSLKSALDKEISTTGKNTFYACRIDGTFSKINVRSEIKQEEPFNPLDKVMETDQRLFDYSDVKGTLVALYCPSYASQINSAGWHIHFISEDRTKGGHVLDLQFSSAEAVLDKTDKINMQLPDDEFFNSIDFNSMSNDSVKTVEQGK